jgi:hypothetical protein
MKERNKRRGRWKEISSPRERKLLEGRATF